MDYSATSAAASSTTPLPTTSAITLLLVVNASNRLKSWRGWTNEPGGDRGAVRDATFDSAMIGLQGPRLEEVLAPLTAVDLSGSTLLRRRSGERWRFRCADRSDRLHRRGRFRVDRCRRPGAALWELLATRQKPLRPTLCGLGARDTLRLEAGHAALRPRDYRVDRILTRPAWAGWSSLKRASSSAERPSLI